MQAPNTLFKCLSDETRLKIVLLLTRHDSLCVCDLHETLDEPQPKISRHLAELRRCALLVSDKRGKWVYYQLNPDLPNWVRAVLDPALNASRDAYPELLPKLEKPYC